MSLIKNCSKPTQEGNGMSTAKLEYTELSEEEQFGMFAYCPDCQHDVLEHEDLIGGCQIHLTHIKMKRCKCKRSFKDLFSEWKIRRDERKNIVAHLRFARSQMCLKDRKILLKEIEKLM